MTNSCGSDNALHSVFVIPSSLCPTEIKSLENINFAIYPNPTQSIINIEATIPINIELSDITGSKLFARNDVKEIDLLSYPTGVYILKIFDSNHNLLRTEKIVKMP